jgi:hypothetical protein
VTADLPIYAQLFDGRIDEELMKDLLVPGAIVSEGETHTKLSQDDRRYPDPHRTVDELNYSVAPG